MLSALLLSPIPLLDKIPAGAGAALAFWLLAALCLVGALRVVSARNPVHAALALILTLAAISGLYVMLEAPFVWAVQLLVYTGGVTVLYLFVIFLSDMRALLKQRWAHQGWMWAMLPAGVLLLMLVKTFAGLDFSGATEQQVSGGPKEIGKLLFGDLVIPFELSSVLLVVALIGAIILSREDKTGTGPYGQGVTPGGTNG